MFAWRFLSAMLLTGLVPLEIPELPRADAERVPTIREIMQEAHRCRTAYILTVRSELSKPQPDWSLVKSKSTDLVRMGKFLALNQPPRGSAESWEKFTGVYIAHATLLTDAAERTDKDAATRHQAALSQMCSSCHRAHK